MKKTIILVILLNAHCVYASLEKNMTYTQWESLVRHTISKVPELKAVWKLNKKTRQESKKYYLVGGTLRGVLHWLYQNSQNYSYDELYKMQVPRSEELLIIKKTDIDIIIPNKSDRDIIRKIKIRIGGWDVMERSRYENIRDTGSSSIEAFMVNPEKIVDPLGGLKLFYEGRLKLFLPKYDEYFKLPFIKSFKWTITTKIIRFLRIKNDLPYLKTSQEDLIWIKPYIKNEIEFLNKHNGSKSWYRKALGKLYKSNKEDLVKTIVQLKDSYALNVIAGADIKLYPLRMKDHEYKAFIAKNLERKLSNAELELVHKIRPKGNEKYRGKYKFIGDWHSRNIFLYDDIMRFDLGKPDFKYVGVNVNSGRPFIWFLDHIAIHDNARMIAITSNGKEGNKLFAKNLKYSGDDFKVKVLSGDNLDLLKKLPNNSQSVVHLYGPHDYPKLKERLNIAWKKIKYNGHLIIGGEEIPKNEKAPAPIQQVIDKFFNAHKRGAMTVKWPYFIKKLR